MSLSFTPHCLGNGHDLRPFRPGHYICDVCGEHVLDCPPAGASVEVNEAAVSVAAPAASGQSAGIPSVKFPQFVWDRAGWACTLMTGEVGYGRSKAAALRMARWERRFEGGAS